MAGPEPASDRSVEEQARRLWQYACIACHTIPGVVGSRPQVGPPLGGLARRTLIAGRLPNTPQNMVAWIRAPQRIKPGRAMPDMGVTEIHAGQMAAYLATRLSAAGRAPPRRRRRAR